MALVWSRSLMLTSSRFTANPAKMALCACTFQFVERFANRETRVTCQHEVGVGGFSGGDTLRENDVISVYNYFLIIAVNDDQVCHCCSLSFVAPQLHSPWVRVSGKHDPPHPGGLADWSDVQEHLEPFQFFLYEYKMFLCEPHTRRLLIRTQMYGVEGLGPVNLDRFM